MTARPEGAERVYRGMLSLYPAEFRRRFGEDMVQLFHDKLRDARNGNAAEGALVAWMALLADVVVTASHEHLRRNRTMAHSLTSAPSLTSRVLGIAGVVAGVVILAAYVVKLSPDLFLSRVVVFTIGTVLIAFGVHRRQAARAQTLSLVATVAFAATSSFYLIAVVFLAPANAAAFWSGVALWLVSAAFGATTAWIGSVSRIGASAIAIGSLLALSGIDWIGLVSEASPTIFNTLSQVGIVTLALGWIVLGLDVGWRRVSTQQAG